DLEARQRLHEIVNQESLATADIEDLVAGLQALMRDQFLGQRPPTPVVLVAAVTVFAVPVKVILAELFGDLGAGGLVRLEHALQVIRRGGMVNDRSETGRSHLSP